MIIDLELRQFSILLAYKYFQTCIENARHNQTLDVFYLATQLSILKKIYKTNDLN